jgi:hypothetical protein
MASCMIALLLCSRIYFYLTEMFPSTLRQCITPSILKSVSHLDVLHATGTSRYYYNYYSREGRLVKVRVTIVKRAYLRLCDRITMN